jgi:hypothetical protein
MKASKLIEALARQIGEHGDKEVHLTISVITEEHSRYPECSVKSIVHYPATDAFEIYGEE